MPSLNINNNFSLDQPRKGRGSVTGLSNSEHLELA